MRREVEIGNRLEDAIERRCDLAGEIERGEAEPPGRGRLRRTVMWLAVTGVSLYLVVPSLVEVFGSWRDITEFAPAWLVAMALLQAAALVCLWALQRLALRSPGWRPVIASQLAGNALAKIAPGGGAVGAALQYKMLVEAGIPRPRAVAGLTAAGLLVFGFVLALPVLALPALLGAGVDRSLVKAGIAALALLAALCAVGIVLLAFDRPLKRVGQGVQRARNAVRREAEPLTQTPQRLLRERDRILNTLGPHWRGALVATAGRWAFDFAALLAALAATGSTPRLGLVLLAFSAAQLLSQIPLTPGGLGFVEAGLTATLTLTGVSASDAVVATFAYRLFSYWLQLPLGLLGVALHRRERIPAPA